MPYMPPIFPVIRITITTLLACQANTGGHGIFHHQNNTSTPYHHRYHHYHHHLLQSFQFEFGSLGWVSKRQSCKMCVTNNMDGWVYSLSLGLDTQGSPYPLWMSCVYVQLVILFHLDGYDDYDIGRHTEEKNTRFPSWKYDGVWSPVVLAHCLC